MWRARKTNTQGMETESPSLEFDLPTDAYSRFKSSNFLHKACHDLLENHPECSIKSGISVHQKTVALLALGLAILLGYFQIVSYAVVLFIFSFLVLNQAAFRLLAAFEKIGRNNKAKNENVPSEQDLPKVTILVPMYKEEKVVSRSVAAMKALNYPERKLEVFYLIEANDKETKNALQNELLGTSFQFITIPDYSPKTKPKALNYGLQFATGEIISIYDAEDIPHPNQITAAVRSFQNAGGNLAVVQAPLHAYNGSESWIAGQFDLEYAIHFDVWLPMMTKFGWPIPLGGTSNHFNKNILEKVGAWDPYNVTEDADLGYRLAINGYSASMIDLPTREEAPVTFKQWLPQRTRWIKGHIQSLAVLLRHPVKVFKSVGAWGCFGILTTFISALISAGLHAPLLLLFFVGMAFDDYVLSWYNSLPIIISFISVTCAAFVSSAGKRRWFSLLSAPLYWPFMSIAFLRAIWELKTRPYIWSKTPHGISKFKIPSLH